ncbi:hypothetical protein [Aliikangiella coralliicola]|uniref:Uncharacterized protein n=1 Tax=Aliikangiella coralliicola TaxID=2592383 RepID=A0A545TWJ4_9GAMM|nr:hypothetical protein [Aliikangiella coralliicola]TQV81580.1 hypothetical protein FLL46_25880 [Aliikangiella coralliicola]
MNRFSIGVFGLAIASIVSGCGVHVRANDNYRYKDLDSVFGGVTVGSGAQVRNVSSVNGGVDLLAGSKARSVDTVNGSIDIGNNVSVLEAETVNGGIEAGKSLSVEKSLSTVNGGILIGENSEIGKDIVTVNGDIELTRVLVARHVRTNNGDIRLVDGSIVKGDIIVEKSNGGWFSGLSITGDMPVVEIDSASQVEGTIHLYKRVKLVIDEKAIVGEIKRHYSRK